MLKERIKEDLKGAMKRRKETETSTLRMLLASVLNKEKEKRYRLTKEKPELEENELEKESQLLDEEIIEVIFSEVKKRREAIVEFKKGEREDLAEKEKKEIEILKKYLPEQLSEQDIKKLAQEIIKKANIASPKDMGKVMAQLMPKVKGKADGSQVSRIVRELLSQP